MLKLYAAEQMQKDVNFADYKVVEGAIAIKDNPKQCRRLKFGRPTLKKHLYR